MPVPKQKYEYKTRSVALNGALQLTIGRNDDDMPDGSSASQIRNVIRPFLLVADGMSARGELVAVGGAVRVVVGGSKRQWTWRWKIRELLT